MAQRHTHCQPGKRVLVRLRDGGAFIDKFVGNTGRLLIFENHRVRTKHVQSFTLYKPQFRDIAESVYQW